MAVYFIRAGTDGPVKIGHAADPTQRVRELQVGHHETLWLIRTVDGGGAEEHWLHKKFRQHHLRGEWFEFVPEMMTVRPPDIVRPPAPPKQEVRFVSEAAWLANADKLGLLTPDDRKFYGLKGK